MQFYLFKLRKKEKKSIVQLYTTNVTITYVVEMTFLKQIYEFE